VAGAPHLVEEQTVTTEALGLALDRARGDAELAADLAQTGAADESVEQALEQSGVPQPVGDGERL
jgi:hypothetical protein